MDSFLESLIDLFAKKAELKFPTFQFVLEP